MADAGEERGSLALLSEVVAGLGRLVSGELRLARAEAAESLQQAGAGLAKIAIAVVLGLVGLNVLAGAAVAALAAAGLGPAWAAVLVGLALCLLAVGLAMSGRAALRLRGFLPDRTLRNLRRDAEALRAAADKTGV